jgi:hypothetical protein
MEGTCLYCSKGPRPLTEEHVISAALGCEETLEGCQCKQCNDTYGHSLEAPFLNGIVFFRHMLRIPGRDGTVPDYDCRGRVEGREVPVKFTGDGFVEVPPQVVSDVTDEQGRRGKEYRIFRREQAPIIEANLKRRKGDLIWRPVSADKSRGMIEIRAEFDSNVLCLPETSRCVAKYGLNILTHCFGQQYLADRFHELRRFIDSSEWEGTLPAGIVWRKELLQRVQAHPPKHIFIVFADGLKHRVVLLIYLFSLFPFCVVASDRDICVDLCKSFFVDPYERNFSPMLVGAFPFPEPAFSEALAAEPRGAAEQARGAGESAHRWILKTCEERRVSDEHCLCYACGRALEAPAETCPYCKESPFPEIVTRSP